MKSKLRGGLTGLLQLSSASLLSAIGFIVIASSQYSPLDPAKASFVLLFVQTQVLGLTIAKLGIEQVIFSSVSRDPTIVFNFKHFVVTWLAPLTFFISVLIYLFLGSALTAGIAFASIILDAKSLADMADGNARGFYKSTAFANLLNYPLFFLTIFIGEYFSDLSIINILALFLLGSVLRFTCISFQAAKWRGKNLVTFNAPIRMGLQQCLNFLLFRFDQVFLSVTNLPTVTQGGSSTFLSAYLSLAKYPEALSAAFVIVGTVFFPKLASEIQLNTNMEWQATGRKIAVLAPIVAACMIAIVFGAYVYSAVFVTDNPGLPPMAFAIQALLVLPVNWVTFSMLRNGTMTALNRNLALSICVGLLFTLLGARWLEVTLVWVVSVQLAVFICLRLILPSGQAAAAYK